MSSIPKNISSSDFDRFLEEVKGLKKGLPNPKSRKGIKLCKGLKANPKVQQMP